MEQEQGKRTVEYLVAVAAASPIAGRSVVCLINLLTQRLMEATGSKCIVVTDPDITQYHKTYGGTTLENNPGGGWILQTVTEKELEEVYGAESERLDQAIAATVGEAIDRVVEAAREKTDQ